MPRAVCPPRVSPLSSRVSAKAPIKQGPSVSPASGDVMDSQSVLTEVMSLTALSVDLASLGVSQVSVSWPVSCVTELMTVRTGQMRVSAVLRVSSSAQ